MPPSPSDLERILTDCKKRLLDLEAKIDAAEMQDYLITMQNQQLYNQGRYYGGSGASAILGALSNPFAWTELFQSLKRK